MIYNELVTIEDIEHFVNHFQRKYDVRIDREGDNVRITMLDGEHMSDVVVSKGEDIEAELNRLVVDLDNQEYDTED